MAPTWVATVALLSWPLVALWLYSTRPAVQATLLTILGAHLLLPVGASIKFEGVPQFDKATIPSLAAFICCILVARRPVRLWRGFGATEVLLAICLIGPFITSELSTDVIVIGRTVLPALDHYEALSAAVSQFIFLLPFLLGRNLMRTTADNTEVFRALVIAGLVYSIPMLFEIRMSPQLHTWIYGYFPHSFIQQMRDSGFRPVVFMGHGLIVAFFAMTACVAAGVLWRTKTRVLEVLSSGVAATYLGALLVLCKSLGAQIYGAALLPLVLFTRPRTQVRTALVLATIALAYPMLRAADLFPDAKLVEMARWESDERADSLKFRFEQDRQLLERASERFFFGWGRFGRARVYHPVSGDDLTTTDGHWIITMGQFGWLGFLAEFGLLTWPVFRARSALRFAGSTHEKLLLAALALLVAVAAVDLLPNGFLTPWTWLLAGALLGRAEALCSLKASNRRSDMQQVAGATAIPAAWEESASRPG